MKQKKTWKDFWEFIRRTNIHLMVISFIFAFMIWCYVIAGTNPIRGKDVTNVPLSLVNTEELTAKGLTVAGDASDLPGFVDVRIEANVESHKNLRATVNLAEINNKGDVTLNIAVTSTMSGVAVKGVTPARVTLKIDNLIHREVPVTAELTGEAPRGYHVSDPELSRHTVTLTGAEETISRVTRAVCEIPVDNLTANTRASYLLKLYDENNTEVHLSKNQKELPSVIADLKVLPTKFVFISKDDVIAAVTNVKPGYEITDVVIEPNMVEIAAEQSVLNSILSLRTQTINAEEADKSVMLDAELQIPDNIKYCDRSSVDVLVQINEIQGEKTFKNHEIRINNLEDGLKAKFEKQKYTDIMLSGGKSAVDSITAAGVHVYVDMAGITSPGRYTRKVQVEEIAGITDISLIPETVTVIVTK